MRLDWPRPRLSPWTAVYVGVLSFAAGIVAVLLAVGALFGGDMLGGLIGGAVAGFLLAVGLRLIRAQLSDH